MLRSKRRLVAVGSLALLIVTLMTGTAWAAGDPAISEAGKASATTTDPAVAVNLLWIVIGAVLVIFMQAGFALVETGFCRAKHAAHVVSTNFAIFGLGLRRVLPGRLPDHVLWVQLPGILRPRQGAQP